MPDSAPDLLDRPSLYEEDICACIRQQIDLLQQRRLDSLDQLLDLGYLPGNKDGPDGDER